MHDVAKLMEVRLHLVVLQERRGIRRRFAEVGHHCSHRHLARAITQQTAWLQAEAGGVAVLPFTARNRKHSAKLTLWGPGYNWPFLTTFILPLHFTFKNHLARLVWYHSLQHNLICLNL